ncbi:MAG: DUF3618 domain-containing protein [Bryobacterales bacterium]|nr:DUF3618 domain-containing protein [Bryobacterales bacterium]MBV9397846.1 DUF3618 domain-containing protein [Bryobacterales bacterium]
MAEEPDQIKDHIDSTRKELDSNLYELQSRVHDRVDDLRHRVKDATNWRTYVNRYPLAVAGLAFAGGTAIGLALGPMRRSKARHDGHYKTRPDGHYYDAISGPKERSYLWDIVKSAAVGFAASQVKAMMRNAVEGVRHPHEHREYGSTPGGGHPATSSW